MEFEIVSLNHWSDVDSLLCGKMKVFMPLLIFGLFFLCSC